MINDNEEGFENPEVDPGFGGRQDDGITSREDKRENNIDSNLSIKEMREGKTKHESDEDANKNTAAEEPDESSNNDALNYKNDREHGAFNPKNI